jgi:hypothetical protein
VVVVVIMGVVMLMMMVMMTMIDGVVVFLVLVCCLGLIIPRMPAGGVPGHGFGPPAGRGRAVGRAVGAGRRGGGGRGGRARLLLPVHYIITECHMIICLHGEWTLLKVVSGLAWMWYPSRCRRLH